MESIELRQDMPGFYLIAGNLSLEMLKVVILYKYHLSENNHFLFSIVQNQLQVTFFLCLLLVFTDSLC